jgi:transcriptional regulator with XRE-family HTH domain
VLEISQKLKAMRLSSEKSQQEFAALAGVSQRTWSSYESGTTTPKMKVFVTLAENGYPIDGIVASPLRDLIGEAKTKGGETMVQKEGVGEETGKSVVDGSKSRRMSNFPTDTNSRKVPLLKQKVSCGPGAEWESDDNVEEYLSIDSLIPRLSLGRIFAMKAQGSSMLGVGIHSGDYLLFDTDNTQNLRDGLYVFALDGEVSCKRLEFDAFAKTIKIFSMRSANLEKAELIKTLNIKDPDFTARFHIFGRVTCWIHPHSGGD